MIRPQSLLGERFIECEHTQPRAAASEPPPALEPIADGERGRGPVPAAAREQRQGGRPRPRPEHQPPPVRRALPAHPQRPRRRPRRARRRARRDHRARQPGAARDSTRSSRSSRSRTARSPSSRPTPTRCWPRWRASATRSSDSSATPTQVNQATAERSADIEASFAKFPQTLRELRSTMTELAAFSEQATPVVHDLGVAAPDLVRATEALGPFSDAATTVADDARRRRRQGRPQARRLRSADPRPAHAWRARRSPPREASPSCSEASRRPRA